jgi:hypothetical protein
MLREDRLDGVQAAFPVRIDSAAPFRRPPVEIDGSGVYAICRPSRRQFDVRSMSSRSVYASRLVSV